MRTLFVCLGWMFWATGALAGSPPVLQPPTPAQAHPPVAKASPSPAPRPQAAAPAASTTWVFRETYIGELPGVSRHLTWTLTRSGQEVVLRLEEQVAKQRFGQLDRTSHDPGQWGPAVRSEFAGTLTRAVPPFTGTLQRRAGSYGEATLKLSCVNKPVQVHPAFATLVAGWKNNDESMEPAAWAPARSERVTALHCQLTPPGEHFSVGLALVPPRPETEKNLALAGIEWVFVNSDMVIQEGGYRWLPDFAVPAASANP
jgi:hypothetical protein